MAAGRGNALPVGAEPRGERETPDAAARVGRGTGPLTTTDIVPTLSTAKYDLLPAPSPPFYFRSAFHGASFATSTIFGHRWGEDRHELRCLGASVKRTVDNPGTNEDSIALLQRALLGIQPLFDLTIQHIQDFFLSRVIMEVVAEASLKENQDLSDILRLSVRWAANPAHSAPIDLVKRNIVREQILCVHSYQPAIFSLPNTTS